MPTFIIFSPSYNESIGGSVVLHRLCDLINKLGGEAYLYPIGGYNNYRNPILKTKSLMYGVYLNLFKSKFKTFPGFLTPLASKVIPVDAIIIYPEIIFGNPLRGKKIVRWLLYKAELTASKSGLEKSDLIFLFQEAFKSEHLNATYGGELRVLHIRKDIYNQVNFGPRSGTCYMLRKGKGRSIIHDLENSINIDELSHIKIAEIFNRVKTFICYDLYTFYSQYAAMCGCISIVVPDTNTSKEKWQPTVGLRLGVAYGFDDIPWAEATMGKVLPFLNSQEIMERNSVINFIKICSEYFEKND